jgi:hypothetical protein
MDWISSQQNDYMYIQKIYSKNIQSIIFNFLYLKCWLGKECDIENCKLLH